MSDPTARSSGDATVTTLERIVAAFNDNDAESLEALVHPAFDYTLEGRSPLAGRYQGHDGMRSFMGAIHAASDDTLHVEPIVVTTAGSAVILYATLTAQRAGRHLHGENLYVYEFEDGRLRTGRNVPCDQYTWDAFWSA